MFPVLHEKPRSSLPRRIRRAATALALATIAASLPSLAGDASATFRISIQLLPEGAGVCTASTTGGSPQVTCRPTVVAASGGQRQASPTILGYRLPESPLKLAGEMVEVGAENHYAWTESNFFALGEYSSRLLMAGGVQYVEMTVSW